MDDVHCASQYPPLTADYIFSIGLICRINFTKVKMVPKLFIVYFYIVQPGHFYPVHFLFHCKWLQFVNLFICAHRYFTARFYC